MSRGSFTGSWTENGKPGYSQCPFTSEKMWVIVLEVGGMWVIVSEVGDRKNMYYVNLRDCETRNGL